MTPSIRRVAEAEDHRWEWRLPDGVEVSATLDPAMRGWVNEGKSYVPPVGIGDSGIKLAMMSPRRMPSASERRARRTRGVSPTRSRTESAYSIGTEPTPGPAGGHCARMNG